MILKFRNAAVTLSHTTPLWRHALLAAAVALWPAGARAAHPFVTDDTGTLGTGRLQTEVSLAGAPCDRHGVDVDAGLVLHVGLAEAVDVGLSVGAAILPLEGWDPDVADPRLDLKWRLLPALALRLDLAPHLDPSVGQDVEGLVVATHEAGPLFLTANLGAFAHGLWSAERRWLGLVSAAALYAVAPGLALGLEGWGTAHASGLENLSALAALQWGLSRIATLSFGVGPTWDETGTPTWSATFAITSDFGGRPPN